MQTQQVSDAATQVNAVVDHLAAKLSVPASQLWAVLIREARIEGTLNLIIGVALLGVAGFGAWFVRYAFRRYAENTYSEWNVGGVVVGVLSMIVAGIAIWILYGAAIDLLNPQYVAATQILKAL